MRSFINRIIINFNPAVKAVFKAIIWCLWNILSGLAPFLVILFVASTILSSQSSAEARKEIMHLSNECVVLFFCCAMMGEITIEAFLSKVKFSKYSYLGFCSSSFMALLLSCIIYTTIIFSRVGLIHGTETNIVVQQTVNLFSSSNNMLMFQTLVVVFAILYCIFIKSLLLFEEEKMYEKCQQ